MSEEQLEEMGPIDYMVLEWAGDQPVTGEVMPLCWTSSTAASSGSSTSRSSSRTTTGRSRRSTSPSSRSRATGLAEFEGASSGLLGQDDLEEAAAALEPGTVAGVLVWENRWAAPVAVGAPPLRRPARRQRPDPRPGHPRVARRDRSHD